MEAEKTEGVANKQMVVFSTYQVTIRYFEGLSVYDRIVWEGLTLNINSNPIYDPKKRWMQFKVKQALS